VLGGALAMNAGAFGGETWPRVRSVDVCDARGNARRRDAREYSYGYRHIVPPVEGEYFLAAMLEFDPELLVQFFGDHKLARSIVASLARRYRYRTPPLEEVIRPGALLRLRKAGLDEPRLLRLELYDRANADGPGFLATGRHADLHDDHDRILVDSTTNRTFYQYGYLYNADTVCFWDRELTQVETLLGSATKAPRGCLLP
jgi:hypothetical protein